MSASYLHRSLHRIDRLVSEAERLVSDYPRLGKKKGFFAEVLDNEGARRERRTEKRIEGIFAEVYGMAVGLKEEIESYGVDATNERLGEALEGSSGDYEESIGNLRAMIGFFRSRIDQIR